MLEILPGTHGIQLRKGIDALKSRTHHSAPDIQRVERAQYLTKNIFHVKLLINVLHKYSNNSGRLKSDLAP